MAGKDHPDKTIKRHQWWVSSFGPVSAGSAAEGRRVRRFRVAHAVTCMNPPM